MPLEASVLGDVFTQYAAVLAQILKAFQMPAPRGRTGHGWSPGALLLICELQTSQMPLLGGNHC
jgi:hypothetical protein